MFGFDVENSKYQFEADWQFFRESVMISDYKDGYPEAVIAYNMNAARYDLMKAYYQQYGKLYDREFSRPGLSVDDIRRLERLRKLTPEDLSKDPESEYLSERMQERVGGVLLELNTQLLPLDECNFSGENLLYRDVLTAPGMDYIGCMEGCGFQQHCPEQIFLFYNRQYKKAVIAFEYT